MKQMGVRQWDTKRGQSMKRSGASEGNGKRKRGKPAIEKKLGKTQHINTHINRAPTIIKPALHY